MEHTIIYDIEGQIAAIETLHLYVKDERDRIVIRLVIETLTWAKQNYGDRKGATPYDGLTKWLRRNESAENHTI